MKNYMEWSRRSDGEGGGGGGNGLSRGCEAAINERALWF